VTLLIALCSKSSCENTRAHLTCPREASLRLRAGFLEKSLEEIDLILQQHRKLCPGHATLSVSLRQAPGPAAPVVQDAFTLLAAAGQAAHCRKKTVQLHEVQCWFQSSTDKGQLAAALQTRLEHVGAGFLSSDKETLRRLVFTRLVQVFWRVMPQLQKSVACHQAALTSANVAVHP
jgi:predicted lipid-binding transport protein (Tim44 family)